MSRAETTPEIGARIFVYSYSSVEPQAVERAGADKTFLMQADKALVLIGDFLEIRFRLLLAKAQAITVEAREDLARGYVIAFLDEYFYDLAADPCQYRSLGIRSDGRSRMVGGENVALDG